MSDSSKISLLEKMAKVQSELKAPKNQYNSFGKYKYRSKEDIFEAAKPLCIQHGLLLTVTDELVQVGDRYYVEATAVATEISTGEAAVSRGYAREGENKKGMDDAQLTGATSSYAGKYALGNLFGLDDTKDSDNTVKDTKPAAPAKKEARVMSSADKKLLLNAIAQGKSAVVTKKLSLFKKDKNRDEVEAALKAKK